MKNFCLALFFFVTCLASHAQFLYPRVGLTASINTNRPPYTEIKGKIGYTVGVGYSLTLSKIASLQAELNYVLKPFEFDYEESTSLQIGEDVYDVHEKRIDKYAISYFEIPVLLKVSILHPDLFVMGGPSVSMGLGGSRKYIRDRESSYLGTLHEEGTGDIKFSDSPSQNNEDVHFDNRWDVGINVGIGALLFKKLMVECRYNFGALNLIDNRDSKNRYLQFTLSTPIQLKK